MVPKQAALRDFKQSLLRDARMDGVGDHDHPARWLHESDGFHVPHAYDLDLAPTDEAADELGGLLRLRVWPTRFHRDDLPAWPIQALHRDLGHAKLYWRHKRVALPDRKLLRDRLRALQWRPLDHGVRDVRTMLPSLLRKALRQTRVRFFIDPWLMATPPFSPAP